MLVDADPYGGAVAQQLGIMDEVSACSRRPGSRPRTAGRAVRLRAARRDDLLTVVTGLPRADRWVEIRAGALEHLLEVAREHGQHRRRHRFSLEEDPASDFGSAPGRNRMTLGALEVADEVVVVGNADPVGLSRLARALVELRDLTGGAPVRWW